MSHSRLSDPEYRNWITVGRAIQITRNALESIIQNAVDIYHTSLLATLPSNIHAWKSHLTKAHRSTDKRKICWSNSDDTRWFTAGASWEIAKIFMAPLGPRKLDVVNAKTTDISGLLNILEWSPRGTNGIFNAGVSLSKLADVRGARNLWAHAPLLHTTDADKADAFAFFSSLLQDPELQHDKDVQYAINELNNLLKTGLVVIEENELEILVRLQRELAQDGEEFVGREQVFSTTNSLLEKVLGPRESPVSIISIQYNISVGPGTGKKSERESPKSWKWERRSIVHREKFNKLLEYGRDHPQMIKEINDVRVCFKKEFLIGRGSDATRVYVGLSKNGYERAVKRLPKDSCACLAEQEKKMLNQPNTIESNHVVKYRFLDDKFDEDWLYLIMDLCEENLKEFVERSSPDGWSVLVRDIIQRVLMGLADLHRNPNRILHRDLKPSNILRNVHGKWLLADFGISRVLPQEVSTFRSKERGTRDWKAVESCSPNDSSDDVRYKKESDIQVAGMVAFYIATKGEHPFGERPDRLRNLLDGDPVGLDTLKDPVLNDLLSWMLKHDPKDRPSAEEALKHPYLQPSYRQQQFEMLCEVANQPEIKRRCVSSDVMQKLNSNPKDWRNLMEFDVFKYLTPNPSMRFKSSWTDCLRFIRTVSIHWHDRKGPRPEALYLVGDPQEYFLNLFPNLPFEVHRIISSCDWKQRPGLKKYFTEEVCGERNGSSTANGSHSGSTDRLIVNSPADMFQEPPPVGLALLLPPLLPAMYQYVPNNASPGLWRFNDEFPFEMYNRICETFDYGPFGKNWVALACWLKLSVIEFKRIENKEYKTHKIIQIWAAEAGNGVDKFIQILNEKNMTVLAGEIIEACRPQEI